MAVRLEDLAGQADAARHLSRALHGGRVHHAFLFAGPDGVGKLAAARRFAQILMCPARPDPAAACGACPSCRRMAEGGHGDVQVLETGERVMKVDEVREATRALQLCPSAGPFRVLIIRDADKMNPQAQNALLKTLEEPPGGARLVLTSGKPRLILPTVLSRCQRVPFRPVPRGDVAALLERVKGLDPVRADLVAALSLGAPGHALAADPDLLLEARDRIAALDLALEPGDPRSIPRALALAGELAGDKDGLMGRLALLGVWIRDQVLAAAASPERIANQDRSEQIEAAAERRGLTEVLRRARVLDEAVQELGRPENFNPQMLLEQLCLALSGAVLRVAPAPA